MKEAKKLNPKIARACNEPVVFEIIKNVQEPPSLFKFTQNNKETTSPTHRQNSPETMDIWEFPLIVNKFIEKTMDYWRYAADPASFLRRSKLLPGGFRIRYGLGSTTLYPSMGPLIALLEALERDFDQEKYHIILSFKPDQKFRFDEAFHSIEKQIITWFRSYASSLSDPMDLLRVVIQHEYSSSEVLQELAEYSVSFFEEIQERLVEFQRFPGYLVRYENGSALVVFKSQTPGGAERLALVPADLVRLSGAKEYGDGFVMHQWKSPNRVPIKFFYPAIHTPRIIMDEQLREKIIERTEPAPTLSDLDEK